MHNGKITHSMAQDEKCLITSSTDQTLKITVKVLFSKNSQKQKKKLTNFFFLVKKLKKKKIFKKIKNKNKK